MTCDSDDVKKIKTQRASDAAEWGETRRTEDFQTAETLRGKKEGEEKKTPCCLLLLLFEKNSNFLCRVGKKKNAHFTKQEANNNRSDLRMNLKLAC